MPKTEPLQTCGKVFQTVNGAVPMHEVAQIASNQIPADAHRINTISSNQSQEYFSVATTQGFEIIQNDSSNQKLKKKI